MALEEVALGDRCERTVRLGCRVRTVAEFDGAVRSVAARDGEFWSGGAGESVTGSYGWLTYGVKCCGFREKTGRGGNRRGPRGLAE